MTPTPIPQRLDPLNGFPEGMPGSGERVPSDAADFLRDMFLLHKGRIQHDKAENMAGRMTFTYGRKIHDAWESLQRDGMLQRDGDDWIFPLQVNLAEHGMLT